MSSLARPASPIAFACAAAAMALAVSVLAGWWLEQDKLQRAVLDGVPLLPDAALGLLLAAAALALRAGSDRSTARLASSAAALGALLIGGLQAVGDMVNTVSPLSGFHLNLLPEPPHQLQASPLGSLALLLAGAALLAAGRRGRWSELTAEGLAFVLLLTLLPGITVYFYAATALVPIHSFATLPAPALAGFLLLGCAVPLAVNSREGLLGLLRGENGGGMLLRRVLPLALTVLLVAGWLQLRATSSGLLDAHTATTLYTAASFVVLLLLMWRAAIGINRLEADQEEIGETYRAVLDTVPGGVIVSDATGTIALANLQAEQLFGYSEGELLGLPVETLVPDALRGRRKDGGEFVASVSLGPHRTRHGLMVTAIVDDVTAAMQRETEVERINRALRLLSTANHAMHKATGEVELLDKICRVIISVGGYRFAWIGYAGDEAGRTPRPVACEGIEDGFLGEAAESRGRLPSGICISIANTIISTGRPLVVRSVAREPSLLAPWREMLLIRGHASAAAFPLHFEGQVHGVVVIYSGTEDAFVAEECARLEDLAADISYTIGALRAAESRNEAEAALRRSEATLKRAQEIAHIGSWEWDLDTNALRWSAETCSILGVAPDETEPSFDLVLQRTHPDDRKALKEAIDDARHGEGSSAKANFRIVREGGGTRWLHMQAEVEFHDTGPFRVVGVLQDISERKRFEEKLAQLASHDVLTGLPNRHLLNDRLDQALAHVRHSGRMLALVFVDLDRFKIINDTLGHDAGDRLLQEIARRLTECLREGDTVARQGGDEFVVVLTDLAKAEDAAFVAQKMLDALAPPCEIFGREVLPAASIGIALYPRDGGTIQELMMNADKAMYAAKQAGRGQYRFFDIEMNRAAADWLEVGALLHHALERGQMELHYQPKVDFKSGAVIGVEALLRWYSPELGLVPPDRFIPILEETGRILEVGEWVVARACRQARQWQEQGVAPLRIAVNLSPRQFQQRDLSARIRAIIEQEGVFPAVIELEITESMVTLNVERAIATLHDLRELGVRLAIDDFGTGYSSLAALKRFPVDCLKIDRSFVRDVPQDLDDVAITRAIILLAHSMGLSVVAEGVETEAQRSFLIESGCDEMQGYLFAKPLPPEQLAAMLAAPAALAATA